MPNNAVLVQIASEFIEFVRAVEKKAHTPRPNLPKRYKAAELPKDQALMIYEVCVKHLTGEDRARLRRILKKMTEVLSLPI